MFNAMTKLFTNISKRYLPDAFVFAIILTAIIFLCGMLFEGKSAIQMVNYWGDGFWNLMTFSMQMVLVLVTGFTLAKTDIISKLLGKIAKLANTNSQAVVVVTITSLIACYINWGFGLIVSALLAVEVSKNVKKVNFALILASAYSGFLVWHGGLSGSIPLKLTSPSTKIQTLLGENSIGFERTVYSSQNLFILFATAIALIILNYILSRNEENLHEFKYDYETPQVQFTHNHSFADKLESSPILIALIGLAGLVYIIHHFVSAKGFTLNIMIFIFLILGLIFSKTPKRFLFNFQNSVKDSSGIILQFPFYAGMMGMMSSSGLAQSMSKFFVEISSENTFLFFTYLSAGIVNFFVPSGGGQWAVQGPIILPAAQELGIDLSKASMAIAWGDAWSNMVQPFWALPLLSIGRVSLGEMMGYCVIIFFTAGIIASSIFLLF
jgi:short-chain fatty acids transporter